jgi:hypothetical protein
MMDFCYRQDRGVAKKVNVKSIIIKGKVEVLSSTTHLIHYPKSKLKVHSTKVSIKLKDPQARYQEIPDITEPPSKSTISIQIPTNK